MLTRESMVKLLRETGLYLVTPEGIPPERRMQAVRAALVTGARIVQLRDKYAPKRLLLEEARSMKRLCADFGAAFLVNDDVALAWCADADGVHVGQADLPPGEARRLLGNDKLIGVSVSALGEALEAERLGVDYIGVGAMFATPTKRDAELGGIELLRQVRRRVATPLVAIGGVDAANASSIFAAGADAVAVVRGVFAQPDVGAATRELMQIARVSRGEGERN